MDQIVTASQLQRRILDLKQERSLAAGHKPARQKTPPLSRGVRPTSTKSSLYAPAPSKIRQSCPSCSEGYSMPMRKIARDLHKCTFCGIVVRQSGLGMRPAELFAQEGQDMDMPVGSMVVVDDSRELDARFEAVFELGNGLDGEL